jgi:hypothetical protein
VSGAVGDSRTLFEQPSFEFALLQWLPSSLRKVKYKQKCLYQRRLSESRYVGRGKPRRSHTAGRAWEV